MIFPGCEKIIPEFRSICRSTVEFKAILSGVACARDDAVGAIHRPWCAMVVTNCRKINFRQRLQDGLSFWPLQGKQCRCVRLIGSRCALRDARLRCCYIGQAFPSRQILRDAHQGQHVAHTVGYVSARSLWCHVLSWLFAPLQARGLLCLFHYIRFWKERQ